MENATFSLRKASPAFIFHRLRRDEAESAFLEGCLASLFFCNKSLRVKLFQNQRLRPVKAHSRHLLAATGGLPRMPLVALGVPGEVAGHLSTCKILQINSHEFRPSPWTFPQKRVTILPLSGYRASAMTNDGGQRIVTPSRKTHLKREETYDENESCYRAITQED
jgi:hypothetical protein